MPKIEVKVTNADDLYMQVTATLPLAQWREILAITDYSDPTKFRYYGPLVDLMGSIQKAVIAIEGREEVEYEFKPKGEVRGKK